MGKPRIKRNINRWNNIMVEPGNAENAIPGIRDNNEWEKIERKEKRNIDVSEYVKSVSYVIIPLYSVNVHGTVKHSKA